MPLTPRRLLDWKLKASLLRLGPRTLLIGCVNTAPDTPESEGGFPDPDRAAERALLLASQGAALLEICAARWSAGAHLPDEAEELRRLVPVLKRLNHQSPVPFGVETFRASVAAKAAEHGAAFVRDPSGLVLDPALARTAAQLDLGLILGHFRGTPETWQKLANVPDPAGATFRELEASIGRAKNSGADPLRLAADPSLGMGKRKEANTEILRNLPRFSDLGLPIILSPFGQPFAGAQPYLPTLGSALAAIVMGIRSGVHLVRTPQIEQVLEAVLLVDEVVTQSSPYEAAPRPQPRPRRDAPRPPAFGEPLPNQPIRPKLRPK